MSMQQLANAIESLLESQKLMSQRIDKLQEVLDLHMKAIKALSTTVQMLEGGTK